MAPGWLPLVLALEVAVSGGRPKVPMELRRLIREMSLTNRLWGAPRIHGELLKLGIDVAQSTVGFKLLFVLGILRHQRRRPISPAVTSNPAAEWIVRQITEAFPWDEASDYLIHDRDAAYGHAVTRRLSAMGIRDHPTVARSP